MNPLLMTFAELKSAIYRAEWAMWFIDVEAMKLCFYKGADFDADTYEAAMAPHRDLIAACEAELALRPTV